MLGRTQPPKTYMPAAVETQDLRRTFGDVIAVDGISLAVPEGSFYGFLGPNGAGKSTTIKCLVGLLQPTSGSIRILGLDPTADPVAVKRRIGVVPEDLALFERLTGPESLWFAGRVHGIEPATIRQRSDELLALMDLAQTDGRLVDDYSHGMRKKLALAVALLPAPKLLFLDEPFEGIDAVSSRLLKELLRSFVGRGGTVFLTSHILEIVERLSDHIGVIDHGRLIAQGPLDQLRRGQAADKTLEELFLELVDPDDSNHRPDLEWLGR